MDDYPKNPSLPAHGENMRQPAAGWKSALVCCLLLGSLCALIIPEQVFAARKRQTAPASSRKESAAPGGGSCRGCHEKFYENWSPSRHGLAVLPFSGQFARNSLLLPEGEIAVGEHTYRIQLEKDHGWMVERGKKGDIRYRMQHVMGGSNVFYFLTPLQRGRLQVMPLAYDVLKKSWFDVLNNVVRHFIDRGNDPRDWRDPVLSFNTSCFHCHVMQFSTNYDPETETYVNKWAEPGIRCDACHGPADEHARIFRDTPRGGAMEDVKIISWKSLTPQQRSEGCAPCHGRVRPLTNGFKPGERFFDHYDLIALEDLDFYPDGRSRGENHTYARWLMNPCAGAGKLDCVHCHMPGGQYRFGVSEKANEACMPCHQERVRNASAHSNHPEGSEGNQCIGCHMPKTQSGAFWGRDHAMLPPSPASTMAFQSPNACNACHKDKDAAWADEWVRKRQPRDYQAPILERAGLVDAARKKDWRRLPEILGYISNKEHDPLTAVSLIRLLILCDDGRKWSVLMNALKSSSPLVRAAAAEGLAGNFSPEILKELLTATEDEYRLVRIRAAMALSGYPRTMLGEEDFQRLEKASQEFMESIESRPDDWESHYNLGNYLLNLEHLPAALVAYDKASRLNPRRIPPLLNASIAAARLGDMVKAEDLLQRALEIEPGSAVVNFHMALLRADQGDFPQAENHLRETLKADPQMAEAACNLCVLLAKDRMEEGIKWCRKAYELDPEDGKYAYTLAFYERRSGNPEEAVRILKEVIGRDATHAEAILLLSEIYEEQGNQEEARQLLGGVLTNENLSSRDRYRLFLKLQELDKANGSGSESEQEGETFPEQKGEEAERDTSEPA